MKVLLVNGSPHIDGCTALALNEIKKALLSEKIDVEILNLNNKVKTGCLGCWQCKKTKKCVVDDIVNEVASHLEEYDGFVFASPVYYASPNGTLISFLDRLFYSAGYKMRYKVGASVLSSRRAGSCSSFDALNKYFTINNMIVVSSNYWNEIHGNTKEEAIQDEEGLQTMRILAHNMAWIMKCIECGKQNNILPSNSEKKIMTNFIR